jgi:hypothetical protein
VAASHPLRSAGELAGAIPALPAHIEAGNSTGSAIPLSHHRPPRLSTPAADKPESVQPWIAPMPPSSVPVRVHADWTADGVRIWLGLDAEGSKNAHVLASHLKGWLASQGVRALSITCNGKTLYERWTQPGEPVNPEPFEGAVAPDTPTPQSDKEQT